MRVYSECSYAKNGLLKSGIILDNDIIYGVALSWSGLSKILYDIHCNEEGGRVVIFVTENLLLSCDFFKLSLGFPVSYYNLDKVLIDGVTGAAEFYCQGINKTSLSRREVVFLNMLKNSFSINDVSAAMNIELKNAYNLKSILIGKLGLPHEHVLVIMLPFFHSYFCSE